MKKFKRNYKHIRVRKNVTGTQERPRLAVFKSIQHIYAQIIDDGKGVTLVSESDLKIKEGKKSERSEKVGESLAKKALAKNIKQVVFDRGGFKYHGRVAALAQGARKGGLQF